MALIQTAEDRSNQKSAVKVVIFGPSGIGKTSLVWTLNDEKTLVVDMEAGMLSLEGWQGDSIDVRKKAQEMGQHPWVFLKNLACLISGPNPAVVDEARFFSKTHYDAVVQTFGSREEVLGKYDTIFLDSITMTGRWAMSYAGIQPEAFTKEGKKDTRGQYGLLGQEMVGGEGLLPHLQHCPDKNVVMVGILNQEKDDYGRTSWVPQIEGGKTGKELPGIMDEVISMVELEAEGGQLFRAFVCQTLNRWRYPAKDRSGRLGEIEEPHLGKLIEKMRAGSRHTEMVTAMPDAPLQEQESAAQQASPHPEQQEQPEQAQAEQPALSGPQMPVGPQFPMPPQGAAQQ